MNHDDETRSQQPSIAVYRGCGLNITMLCARCKMPRNQLGSRKLMWRGTKRAVCAQCVGELRTVGKLA